jgi:TPR repeat protein
VPKDLAKAKELYQKAAAKGNSDARVRLDQLMDQ